MNLYLSLLKWSFIEGYGNHTFTTKNKGDLMGSVAIYFNSPILSKFKISLDILSHLKFSARGSVMKNIAI